MKKDRVRNGSLSRLNGDAVLLRLKITCDGRDHELEQRWGVDILLLLLLLT